MVIGVVITAGSRRSAGAVVCGEGIAPGGGRRFARSRQADAEPGATFQPVRDRDPPFVEVDDRFGDREPQARSATRRAGSTPEPFEDPWHVLGPDPGAIVLDLDDCLRRVVPDTDADGAAARGVADGIVDEDHDQLAQPDGIAADDRWFGIEEEANATRIRGLRQRAGPSAAMSPSRPAPGQA